VSVFVAFVLNPSAMASSSLMGSGSRIANPMRNPACEKYARIKWGVGHDDGALGQRRDSRLVLFYVFVAAGLFLGYACSLERK